MQKKCVMVGIILLFVGVTMAPTINFNTVKASQDDDLVEVTTQACGIKGYGNTTVKLTREQYRDLELYLVDFRARLNQTSTREEAIPIFIEAVMELDRYGLLPRGMSIAHAQRLVIGVEPSEKIQEFHKKILDRSKRGNPNNTFCLLAGNVDKAWFWNVITFTSGATIVFLIFLYFFLHYNFGWASYTMFALTTFVAMSFFVYGLFMKPINLISCIDFTPSAKGSIYSIGLSGLYQIKSEFEGNIVGFTGIRIMKLVHFNPPPVYISPGAFFLGSAVSMSLETHE
jgi:hypothetical protein